MSNKDLRRLDFIGKFLTSGSQIAELGEWKGDFSNQLLAYFKPSVLTLIDPWRFEELRPHSWYGGSIAKSQSDMDKIYYSVTERFSSKINAGVVRVHRGSIETALIEDCDLLYVDGDHSFDGVSSDISIAISKMQTGSLIIFDDYGVGGWWSDGVTKAVHRYVESQNLFLIDKSGTQCACRIIS